MSREIIHVTEHTPYGTIYDNCNQLFRIVEISKDEFIIQLIIETTYVKGFLWWKKTMHKREYKEIDMYGNLINLYNVDDIKIYPTIEAAEEWIKDYSRYPIIH